MMTTWLRCMAGWALALVATCAAAAFQIDALYSNADGSVQYVVLRETSGANGQQAFNGLQLVATQASVVKTYTFAGDLPSSATANKRVLLASPGFVALGLIAADYVLPDRFLAIDGATLNFAGIDQLVYPPLPIDGANALDRSGAVAQNVATNFAGATATAPPLPVTVVEYYDAVRDHYFISSLEPDIDALDTHRIPGWIRTGQSFAAYPSLDTGGPGAEPVCRFYIPPQSGDSHFFSASPAECDAVLQKMLFDPAYAGYVYETPSAFFIELPDTSNGACPPATIPVYRLWNQRIDSNHRYTTDAATKAQMLARGYIAEGYGADAVAMCAPAVQPIDLSNIAVNAVVWAGTQFVAVGEALGGGGLIFTSRDGTQWSVRSSGTPALNGIAWSGTQIVAVGAAGTIITSPDGYRWYAQASPVSTGLNAITSSGAQFLVAGDGGVILSSPDGVAWTFRLSNTTLALKGVAWNGVRYVLVGATGTILTLFPTGSGAVRVSGTGVVLSAVAARSDGRLVAVGGQGTILGSNDGITWTSKNSGTGTSLTDATASDTQYVVVGKQGKILTSPNSTTWTAQQSQTSKDLAGVAWSGTLYVAVGAAGTFLTSPDGATWTQH